MSAGLSTGLTPCSSVVHDPYKTTNGAEQKKANANIPLIVTASQH